MNTRRLFLLASGMLICVGAVSAQSPPQQTPARPDDQKSSAQAQMLTVSGCVQKETDILKHDAIPGNMGMGDEYVLIRATLKAKDAASEPPSAGGNPDKAEPESSEQASSNFGKVYRVTGDKESELKNYMGQRVEIVGSFKHPEDASREFGATGTSGRSPEGGYTKDNTPEITISSIAPASGTCAPLGIK